MTDVLRSKRTTCSYCNRILPDDRDFCFCIGARSKRTMRTTTDLTTQIETLKKELEGRLMMQEPKDQKKRAKAWADILDLQAKLRRYQGEMANTWVTWETIGQIADFIRNFSDDPVCDVLADAILEGRHAP